MVPGNAALVVVGDTNPDAIAAALEARLGAWPPGPVPAQPALEPVPAPPEGRPVYLIDKAGAPQSVLAIGRIGAPRKSPDFHAMVVMNAILGGQFASRINLNLRQEKGYSYGAESGFAFYLGPGPFVAGGPVESGVTKEALEALFKEFSGIADAPARSPTRRAGLRQGGAHPRLSRPLRDDIRRGRTDRDPGRRRVA